MSMFALLCCGGNLGLANRAAVALYGLGDGLDVDLDVDVLADEDAAGLERLVPLQPEVPAIDPRLRREGHALVAPGVLAAAELFDVELHGLGHPVDRQVAGHGVLLLAGLLDLRALVRQLRVLLGVEEVGRLEVPVALRLARVDARDVDLDLHRRLRRVRRVEGELGGPLGEVAADLRENHVPHAEADVRVLSVDRVGGHLVPPSRKPKAARASA